MTPSFIKKKQPPQWLLHVFVWALLFGLPYIFSSAYYEEYEHGEWKSTPFLLLDTVTRICWMGLFYANTVWFIPQLLYRNRFLLFLLCQIGCFGLIMALHGWLFTPLTGLPHFKLIRSASHNVVAFIITVAVAIAYRTLRDKRRAEQKETESEKEQLTTELSFLRSQISPHFLFNVLNNLVAMARLKHPKLESSIIQLSSLLQYMLYETDEEKVSLKTEVEYLQTYIELQQQRFNSQLEIRFDKSLEDDGLLIEPMLLIPFVENAFKHGTGMLDHPQILVHLGSKKGELEFSVSNKFVAGDGSKDKASGIGLANVSRRLELLYANQHELLITNDGNWFHIHLHIHFN